MLYARLLPRTVFCTNKKAKPQLYSHKMIVFELTVLFLDGVVLPSDTYWGEDKPMSRTQYKSFKECLVSQSAMMCACKIAPTLLILLKLRPWMLARRSRAIRFSLMTSGPKKNIFIPPMVSDCCENICVAQVLQKFKRAMRSRGIFRIPDIRRMACADIIFNTETLRDFGEMLVEETSVSDEGLVVEEEFEDVRGSGFLFSFKQLHILPMNLPRPPSPMQKQQGLF